LQGKSKPLQGKSKPLQEKSKPLQEKSKAIRLATLVKRFNFAVVSRFYLEK